MGKRIKKVEELEKDIDRARNFEELSLASRELLITRRSRARTARGLEVIMKLQRTIGKKYNLLLNEKYPALTDEAKRKGSTA